MTFHLILKGNQEPIKYKPPAIISQSIHDFIKLKTIPSNGVPPKFPKSTIGLYMDPGSVNFALCVIKNNRVVGTQMLQNPLKEIKAKTFDAVVNTFIFQISQLLNAIKPDVIVCERWVVRGFGSNSAGLIGLMMGIIIEQCRWKGIYYHDIMSGQWKVKVKKVLDLKDLYKIVKKEYKLEPHQLDSMLIGRYTMNGNTFDNDDIKWINENLKHCQRAIQR